MPGGWTLSMAWIRLPGQTWTGVAASFLGMWVVMMTAMMLPSLAPMLCRYVRAVGRIGAARLGRLTALVAAAYICVWTLVGLAVFPLGAALATFALQQPALARAEPLAVAVIFLLGGALQFTTWKAHQLSCCRRDFGRGQGLPADAGTAWRYGLHHGVHCVYCCVGLTAILLAVGVMDLVAMAAVAAAISAERLAPGGGRIARAVGAVLVVAGFFDLVLALVRG